ncbi:hypothetical protein J41TS12_10900 [Paenibacillus antibioticophila]|uniref:LexA repressor DNA-binding domain-containing protein n=1 Tax=Paenibacillus antibioticophila TaxID=1274374 RepID=A0A919XNV7_9BACL|nr:hypothetical protein [Paenibacillus antibioticophila]GIO36229.1 hypothetical protein J41TS12_10900 [Paenibacillus antibioticophila]
MTNKPLTRRQAEALDFIKSFVARKGYPPSVRQLARGLNMLSSSTAFSLLEQLVRKGYVNKGSNPRELQIVGAETMADKDAEIDRLRKALIEAKGDFEYIFSWDALPDTLVTCVKTAIKSIDQELGGEAQ